MEKKFTRMLSLVLAVFLIATLLPVSASAADPVSMMISWAEARVGKTGSQLGYSQAWCASFVCDAAAYAGQSNVIPDNAWVPSLYSLVTQNGRGRTVPSPQPGDLVFYYCSACGDYMHVGLVVYDGYTIEGNLRAEGYSESIAKKKPLSGSYSDYRYHSTTTGTVKREFVRPAYDGAAEPLQKPSPSTSRSSYTAGENIIISWNPVSGSQYYCINVYKDDQLIYEADLGSNTSYTLMNAQPGNYVIWVSSNTGGIHELNSCEFTVVQQLEKPVLTIPRSSYIVGETVTISWNAISGNGFYWVSVFRDGALIADLSMDQYTSYTMENVEPGNYSILVSANNSAGSFCSDPCEFIVAGYLDKPLLSTANSIYTVGDDITISWNAISGNGFYWINVYRNDSLIVDQSTEQCTSYTLENAQSGSYRILVSANNTAVNACSDPLTFEVKLQCADGHTWSEGVVTTEPTEETEGVRTYTCTVCGETKTESIATLSHTTHSYVTTITPPTCTERGYTTHTCRCGDSYVDTYVEATDHTWGEGVVEVEPTEEQNGLMVYYCQICHDVRGEVIEQLPHTTHSYTDTVTAPTCTEQGYTTHTCECGETYKDSYVDALGHSWNDGVVTREPTEDEEGIRTLTCTRCDETSTESISVIPHTHIYTDTVTAPTCTEQGYTTHTCECDETYRDGYVDALGHNWNSGVVTREPTEETEGVKTFTCARCDETRTESIPVLEPAPVLPSITGSWTTDFTFAAADLGVSAPDSVLRATLTFGEDGSASATWEAVDLTAMRLYFRDMFVNAYYALAYGMGITDLNEIEAFCQDSTGMSVSAYMDTIVTDEAIAAAFTPAPTAGSYSYNDDHSAICTNLAIMGVESDASVANSFVIGDDTLYLNAASYGKPDYTFVCTRK